MYVVLLCHIGRACAIGCTQADRDEDVAVRVGGGAGGGSGGGTVSAEGGPLQGPLHTAGILLYITIK